MQSKPHPSRLTPAPSSFSLLGAPSDFIAGRWISIEASDTCNPSTLFSSNPSHPSQVVFACTPNASHVDLAVIAARKALAPWSALPLSTRAGVLKKYADICKARQADMANMLCDEIGKVMWECTAEASILAGKVDITLTDASLPESGLRRVTDFSLNISQSRLGNCHFKPHGVMAVLGPFNFPAHLPNGHIIPALLMGNTIVFKPSDKAPAVGQLLTTFFNQAISEFFGSEAGTYAGVINLVQGKANIASALVRHPHIDAIAFTGSWPVARRIMEANLDFPGRILALELGGSNPAIVMPDADLRASAIEIVRSAFNTSGQRCTCTRRAIIHNAVAGKLIPIICKMASNLLVADPRSSAPTFMGPLINEESRTRMLQFQNLCNKASLQPRGSGKHAEVLVAASHLPNLQGFFVTPSVINVDRFSADPGDDTLSDIASFDPGCDIEIFGPLLRITTVDSLDQAIQQANATRFGLAAAIFTSDKLAQDRFLREVRAGCLNVNTGTAGASSKLPFGGLGLSGNHRPAGSFALDYCAYPVASMVENDSKSGITINQGMRVEEAWFA